MSSGARVQAKPNQKQRGTLLFLTLPTLESSSIKTKPQSLTKSMDICYNKGLISLIINTQKIWMKSFIMTGSTSLNWTTLKVSSRSSMSLTLDLWGSGTSWIWLVCQLLHYKDLVDCLLSSMILLRLRPLVKELTPSFC
jgi:hypothetical protein